MTNISDQLTNRLRREPAELLEATKHHCLAELTGENVVAAFPVILTQSLETILWKMAVLGAIVVAVANAAVLVTGTPAMGLRFGIITGIVMVFMTGSKQTLGVVAVTASDYILIELKKKSLLSGRAIERIDRSSPLPEPRPHKGGMHSDALPFAKDGDRGWRYCALTDHGTGYMQLFGELRSHATNDQPTAEWSSDAELVASR